MTREEIKENIPEQIICSAIYFNDNKEYEHQPINIDIGFVVCGFRHHNIFMTMYILDPDMKYKNIDEVQGFLTNKNRFVNREEGIIIAEKQNQLPFESYHSTRLFSEDLY
jgi:hypothetical protein